MQVSRLNSTLPTKLEKDKNNGRKDSSVNNNVKFSGAIDTLSLGVANAIENGGLAVSFTLQDMLGTNLPRPIMGLRRNSKENKGQKNLKFAAKELVREMTTGPSMFIIPGVMLAAGKKIFGNATEVPMKFIKSFGDIHAANPLTEAGKAIGKQDFYKNAFTEMLKNAKAETEVSQETIQTASDFAKRLAESLKDKAAKKDTISKLSDEFIEIAKSHAQDAAHTDFTKAAISNTTSASFKETVSHMLSYADDIVEKAKGQDTGKIAEYIKKLSNQKVIGRLAANVLMYAAVMTFLQVIPKLYNKAEGKGNAGLKGLMKEETLNNKPAEKTDNKNQVNPAQDKSKVSFGSSAQIVNKLTGSGIVGRMAQGIEFQGPNVSFPLLLGIMGFGILLPRVKQSKDKYDKEEILRRDLVTCATMCFAEKELRKGFSKLNETSSGLVLAAKEKGFQNKSTFKKLFDYLRPIKGVNVLSTEQIVSKYSGIDKYKDGIKGFCEFIEGQGGNLKKVFSLTDESKGIIESLLQKEGKTLESADNSVIKEVIEKAKGSEELNKLAGLFKDKNNPWVTKAKTLNARFTALSVLVLVPAFLGFLLPWINEKATKKRYAEEHQNNPAAKINNNQFDYIEKSSSVFKDIENFTK